jgi:two-component sensor histidine kinase
MEMLKYAVLLIDQDPAGHDAKLLEGLGYAVIHLSTEEEALEVLKKGNADLVLMALDTGHDVARRILAHHEIPLLFLSNFTDADRVAKAAAVPCYGYVVRSTGLDVLNLAIQTALRLHHERRASREAALQLDKALEETNDTRDAIELALEEKNSLFHELLHRIKNSFVMISSLFLLESRRQSDPGTQTLINNLGHRIKALEELYALLHNASDIERVQLDEYLDRIIHTYGNMSDATQISVQRQLESIDIDIRRAAPVGLILNELLANAFKYAFPDGNPGTVYVELKKALDDIELLVSDDGIGLPTDFDPIASPGFGMQLIRMLTKQLRGKVSCDRLPHTTFRLVLPASVKRSPPAKPNPS